MSDDFDFTLFTLVVPDDRFAQDLAAYSMRLAAERKATAERLDLDTLCEIPCESFPR